MKERANMKTNDHNRKEKKRKEEVICKEEGLQQGADNELGCVKRENRQDEGLALIENAHQG